MTLIIFLLFFLEIVRSSNRDLEIIGKLKPKKPPFAHERFVVIFFGIYFIFCYSVSVQQKSYNEHNKKCADNTCEKYDI
jgi:hypothetical protein